MTPLGKKYDHRCHMTIKSLDRVLLTDRMTLDLSFKIDDDAFFRQNIIRFLRRFRNLCDSQII
ncbi:hypothetical protein V1478_014180 [Vespula squamosa]|uniref:Uncharacterized protein n=1 Tax=Vespula squamosa TaxID=30214 RepID=A0ABD2A796_VESSQ